jgi:short subunit dehydrogenase-like uncharacterized protein
VLVCWWLVVGRVVISTVGPFVLHGSGLVKACVENGTHYTDTTGTLWCWFCWTDATPTHVLYWCR